MSKRSLRTVPTLHRPACRRGRAIVSVLAVLVSAAAGVGVGVALASLTPETPTPIEDGSDLPGAAAATPSSSASAPEVSSASACASPSTSASVSASSRAGSPEECALSLFPPETFRSEAPPLGFVCDTGTFPARRRLKKLVVHRSSGITSSQRPRSSSSAAARPSLVRAAPHPQELQARARARRRPSVGEHTRRPRVRDRDRGVHEGCALRGSRRRGEGLRLRAAERGPGPRLSQDARARALSAQGVKQRPMGHSCPGSQPTTGSPGSSQSGSGAPQRQ